MHAHYAHAHMRATRGEVVAMECKIRKRVGLTGCNVGMEMPRWQEEERLNWAKTGCGSPVRVVLPATKRTPG